MGNNTSRKTTSTSKKIKKFGKFWAFLYIISFCAFEYTIKKIDILPNKLFFTITLILIILSVILLVQLYNRRIAIWAKICAIILSFILMTLYGLGTMYSFGMIQFLDKVSTSQHKTPVEVTEKPFNIYITGIDTYGTIDKQGRSDVNMLVTVNPKTHQILLTSIPRDYKIRLKKHKNAVDKLTHTGFYGVDDTLTSVESLLDTKINYYVKVNFSTVAEFINAIGGVDVHSDYTFVTGDYGYGEGGVRIKKGKNHLDGATALSFARERHAFKDGDNQRIKNQQLVFEAVLKKAMTSKTMLLKYNKLLKTLTWYFEMNLSSEEIRSLVKMQISNLNESTKWTVEKNTLSGFDSEQQTYSAGRAYVMEDDPESIEHAKNKIQDILTPPDANGYITRELKEAVNRLVKAKKQRK